MDGGRRLLRSITGFGLAEPVPALAGASRGGAVLSNAVLGGAFAGSNLPVVQKPRLPPALRVPRRRLHARGVLAGLSRLLMRPGAGLVLTIAVVGGAGTYGALRGGEYAAFAEANGSLGDVIARNIGFGISAVVISSDNGMGDGEILKASGITARNSLLLLDANEVRNRLKAVPLIKEASVRKLFPDRLMIDVEQRQPYGLWQKDGNVAVVSADGLPIDVMRDDRFAALPFVVGPGANERIGEFASLLDASGELRAKIRAGVLVAGRRWNLKMVNGVEVKLPETAPEKAVMTLATLDHEARVLDKDVLWLDFRQPDRMIAHLSVEAAAARADAMAAKKRKGGQP